MTNPLFEPEPYGYHDFIKDVTGFTFHELMDRVEQSKEFKLVVSALSKNDIKPKTKTPEDIETTRAANKIANSWLTYMFTKFEDCCAVPIEKAYTCYQKFRNREEYINPSDDPRFAEHRSHYDPIYDKIEKAYREGNVTEFKKGIDELVDLLMHK